jgi:beta-glucosidase
MARMATAFIAGAQRELIASVKHLALNSIEDTRFHVDVRASERTLHEVYLPHFEQCVRAAHVGSVMSAYNKVNGKYCAENAELLRGVLKGRWGFLGFVESDWVFGVHDTERSLSAGLDIEMPGENHYGDALLRAYRAGRVSLSEIDDAVRRILRVKVAFGLAGAPPAPPAPTDEVIECSEHQDLASEVARQSFVLLVNRDQALPLSLERDLPLAVVGSLASLENTGDHGSSAVKSSFVISALEGLRDRLPAAQLKAITRDWLEPADRETLRHCSAAVVVVGLTWREEGERIPLMEGGGDRDGLRLPAAQERLVRDVSALVPRTIVVLEAGSAVEVRSFVDEVSALLVAWYPGMLGGEALADVLLGDVSPSGKLPISMPRAASDLVPFDHRSHAVDYEYEHGYRQLARARKEPEFPFGFGLSYTSFRYERLALSHDLLEAGRELVVTVTVTNAGVRNGSEVVQLYLSAPESAVPRAVLWLAGFGRLELAPGQTRVLRMRIGEYELRHYDAARGRFEVERTRYILRAGPSSRDLPLEAEFRVL